MPKVIFRALIASATILLLVIYYTCLIITAKPKIIEKELTRNIETLLGGQFQAESFKLSYFPLLDTEFRNSVLRIQAPAETSFKAGKIKIHFGFFGFLFGKADISEIEVEDAGLRVAMPSKASFRSLDADNLKLKAKMLNSFKRIQVQWTGDLEGVKHSFSGKAILGIQDPAKRDWSQVFLSADVSLKEFPLTILKNSFLENNNVQIKEGQVSGQYHLQKEKQNLWIYANGRSQLTKLVYEVNDETNHLIAPATNADFDIEAGWQPLEDQVAVTRSLLNLPFGKMQLSGKFLLGNREIKESRVTFSDLVLEVLPQYYLPFKEAVPFNLGFSGKSNLEMSIEGALDHLSFHGNWDLTPAFLSYAGYFSKPKDIHCDLNFDLLLKNAQLLGGDFSLKLNDAGFKGSLVNFNVGNGEGELNILSNKFHLENWAALLPEFSEYTLSGEIKVLANFSGSLLRHPKSVKTMINVTLEKGQIAKGSEEALKNVYFSLDYSPMALEIRQGQIQAGEYPLFFNATIFDPKTQPHIKASVHSDQADISKLLSSLDSFGKKLFPQEARKMINRMQLLTRNVLPEGQPLNKLEAEIETKGKDIVLSELKCQVYEGNLQAQGKITPGNAGGLYSGSLEIDRLNLARFFTRSSRVPKLMNGNFFLKGDFQGNSFDPASWQSGLTGKGVISMTNGEFNSFSVEKSISGIQGLSMLASKASETTPFDDFQTEFQIADGKFKTEKATLISPEIKASGDGEIAFTGVLNYRLNAFLSLASMKDILGGFLGEGAGDQGEYLGPIPMLLSGEWNQPELKPDPSGIAEFTENFNKKKLQKVLRNFLPEDVLFKRTKSS